MSFWSCRQRSWLLLPGDLLRLRLWACWLKKIWIWYMICAHVNILVTWWIVYSKLKHFFRSSKNIQNLFSKITTSNQYSKPINFFFHEKGCSYAFAFEIYAGHADRESLRTRWEQKMEQIHEDQMKNNRWTQTPQSNSIRIDPSSIFYKFFLVQTILNQS